VTAAGCGSGTACIDLAFGPTQAIQCWSLVRCGFPDDAWVVAFSDGNGLLKRPKRLRHRLACGSYQPVSA